MRQLELHSGGGVGRLTLLLLVLLGWLQYSLWFGKNGMHDLLRLENDILAQKNNNAQLKARNDQMLAEINDLSSGQESVEERSRSELGMIKLGETFYRLMPEQAERLAATSTPQENQH